MFGGLGRAFGSIGSVKGVAKGNVVVSLAGHAENGSTLSTYTFTAAIPGAGRYIIGVGTRKTSGTPSITSLTASGATATQITSVASASGSINLTAMYIVDATAAGDVVVNLAAASLRCGIGVWSISGYGRSQIYGSAQTSTANPATATLAVPANGAVIGYLFGGDSTLPTATWTNLTEDFDLIISSTLMHTGAHASIGVASSVLPSVTLTGNSLGDGAIFVAITP